MHCSRCCCFCCFFWILVQGADLHYIDIGNEGERKAHILATLFVLAAGTFLARHTDLDQCCKRLCGSSIMHCTIELCFFVSWANDYWLEWCAIICPGKLITGFLRKAPCSLLHECTISLFLQNLLILMVVAIGTSVIRHWAAQLASRDIPPKQSYTT